VQRIEHWINGSLTAGTSGRTSPVYNPATGEQTAAVDLADPSDVDAAVASARAAAREWRHASLSKRAAVLFAFREALHRRESELAAIVTAEHGKVTADALGEIARGLENVEFATGVPALLKGGFSEQAATTSMSIRSGSRWVSSPASPPSTSRSWCRCGCAPTRSRQATPSS
jgi:malonate-semialdehyde dehydrogenase (acetylating)/methylmalonate-semialdehyde dehydrogenase